MADPNLLVSPVLMNVIFPREMRSPFYVTVPETSPVGKVSPPEHPARTASPRMQVQTSQPRHHLVTELQVEGIVTSQAPLQGISIQGAGAGRGYKAGPLPINRLHRE